MRKRQSMKGGLHELCPSFERTKLDLSRKESRGGGEQHTEVLQQERKKTSVCMIKVTYTCSVFFKCANEPMA